MILQDDYWKHTRTGIIIALINAILILNASWYFLVMANFPILGWLSFNICTPSVLLFLAGALLKRTGIMAAAVPFLLFFGGGGLFIFGWNGGMVFAQMGHIAMISASVYILYIIIREKRWKNAVAGIIVGAVILAGLFPFQQQYVSDHTDLLKKLGDPAFEEFIKKKETGR